LKQDLT